MTASESIQVAVEIVDEYSEELEKLDKKLDKIDADDLEIDLDIDDHGAIESTKASLEALEEQLTATLEVAVSARNAIAKREALERDLHTTLHVDTDENEELINDNSLAGPPIDFDDQIESLKQRLHEEFAPVRVGTEAIPNDDDSQTRTITYEKEGRQESITATDSELLQTLKDLELDFNIPEVLTDGGQLGFDTEDITVHCECDCGDSLDKFVEALGGSTDNDSSPSRSSKQDIGAKETYNYLKNLIETDARTFSRNESEGDDDGSNISVPKPDLSIPEFDTSEIEDSVTIEVSDWASTKTFLETGGDDRVEQNGVDIRGGFRDSLRNIMDAEGIPDAGFQLYPEREPKLAQSDQVIKQYINENIVRTINNEETGEFIMPGSDKATSLPDDFSGRKRVDEDRYAADLSPEFNVGSGDGNDKNGSIFGFVGGLLSSAMEDLSNMGEGAGGLSSMFSKLGKTLKKYKPTMQMWWSLIALMTPMLFTAAAGALGLVAALGALAGVGAVIGGFGLLGYGSGLKDSMKKGKQRMKKLAKSLYGIFRPVMEAFRPIIESIFSSIPRHAQQLVGPLKNLTQFGGFFEQAVGGVFDFIRRLIVAVNNLAGPLMQIGRRFGKIFGDLIIKLFKWLVRELYNNQNAFLGIAKIIGSVIVILYNLFKVVSFVLSVFSPLFTILAKLSGLLSNKFVVGLLTAVTVAGVLVGLIWGLTAAMNALSLSMVAVAARGIASMISGLIALIGQLVTAIGLTGTLASLLTYVTFGAIAIGAIAGGMAAMDSMSGSGSSFGGSGGGSGSSFGGGSMGGASGGGATIINVDGDVNNRAYQRLQDSHSYLYDKESGIEKRMTPSTNSES